MRCKKKRIEKKRKAKPIDSVDSLCSLQRDGKAIDNDDYVGDEDDDDDDADGAGGEFTERHLHWQKGNRAGDEG